MSQRKPMASDMAVVRGTPRTARLATAKSQRTRVRMVEAAKTTEYCLRKVGLVKSTSAGPLTASLSLVTIQAAASAQPRAREARGLRASVGSLGARPVRGAPPVGSPRSQYSLAGPAISEQGSLLVLGAGVGLGVGAAVACAAYRTTAVWRTAVTAPILRSGSR